MISIVKIIIPFFVTLFIEDIKPEYLNEAIKIASTHKIDIVLKNHPSMWYTAVAECHLNRILINTGHEYWRDHKKRQIEEYKNHYLSTDNPNHMIIHEVGHILLSRKIGCEKYNELQCRFFPLRLDYIKKSVSNYAARNMTEFYSEVYVGLHEKKTYSKDVMNLYYSIEQGKEN